MRPYVTRKLIFRLGKDIYGGAWCPKEVIEPGVREWIEIDLHREYRLTRTATQGRFGGGQGQEYAENFVLEYWRPSAGKWMTYKNHSGHSVSHFIFCACLG